VLATARSFADEIRKRGEKMERKRRMSRGLARRMASGGLFGMLVPARYGGGEVHPREFFETLEATAKADGAVGWCLMIGATTGLLAASLDEDAAQAIYGDHPEVITSGVTAPNGRAEHTGAGLEVSGRWAFGSACQVSDWITGGCFVYQNGERVQDERGPRMVLAFFRPEDVKVHDTWHTAGLCGTGSHDIEVKRALVPDGHFVVLGQRPRVDAPLYRFPTFGLLALGVSAVSMGIASHAVDAFLALAADKVPTGRTHPLATRTSAHMELAAAVARLRSARAYTLEVIGKAFEQASGTGRLAIETKADLRLAATNNTWAAAEAVTRLYHAGGGSSVYLDNELQRCFRDVHVTTQHLMVAKPSLAAIGRVRLGLAPGAPL